MEIADVYTALETAEKEGKPLEAKPLIEGIKATMASLREEAKGNRESKEAVESKVGSLEGTLAKLTAHLGIEDPANLDESLKAIKEKERGKMTAAEKTAEDLANLTKRLDERDRELASEKKSGAHERAANSLKDALVAANINPASLGDASALIMGSAEYTDGTFTIDGKAPAEVASKWLESRPHLIQTNQKGGAGSAPGGGGAQLGQAQIAEAIKNGNHVGAIHALLNQE